MIRSKFGLGVLIATFTNGCVAYTTQQISSSEPQISHSQSTPDQKTEPPGKAPAIIVHIDPQTGRIISSPATPAPGQVPQPPLDTAKPPLPQLQETLSPTPGGGVMIELDERFRTPLTATIDADGKVRFEHKPAMPGANDNE
jgi:hypothetical protein